MAVVSLIKVIVFSRGVELKISVSKFSRYRISADKGFYGFFNFYGESYIIIRIGYFRFAVTVFI